MGTYKAFDQDMRFEGMKFEVGGTYEEKAEYYCDAKLCYYESAADLLLGSGYINFNNNYEAVFHRVTPLEGIDDKSGENAMYRHMTADKLSVGERVARKELAKEAVEEVKEIARKAKHVFKAEFAEIDNNEFNSVVWLDGDAPVYTNNASENKVVCTKDRMVYSGSGTFPLVISEGSAPVISSSGNSGTYITLAPDADISVSGGFDKVMNFGNGAKISTVGGGDEIVNESNDTRITCSGGHSRIASVGEHNTILSVGEENFVACSGANDVIVNISRNGAAKGGMGSFITLAEYKRTDDGEYFPSLVLTKKVDGVEIMPDTWYALDEGIFKMVAAHVEL